MSVLQLTAFTDEQTLTVVAQLVMGADGVHEAGTVCTSVVV